MTTTNTDEQELREDDLYRQLQTLKDSEGNYVLGTISFSSQYGLQRLIEFIEAQKQRWQIEARKKGVRDGYNYALTDVDLATSLTDAYHRVHEGHKKAIEACRG